jgi:carbonic anhydrase
LIIELTIFLMQILKALIAITVICISLLIGEVAIANPSQGITQPLPIDQSAIHWSYQDTTGPDHWAELDPAFATCQNGQGQSPINLTATEIADLITLDFNYSSVPLDLLNDGHTIQVPYAPGSYITLNDQRYDLLQFHFHSPSEHAIDHRFWDAELHLVHQKDSGELAVVAVLLQTDKASSHAEAFDKLSDNLPTNAGDKIRTGLTLNAQDLLPSKTTTYRYNGSLTTPPCSESVTWLVMSEPVSLPAEQMDRYKKLLNHNNRPLQLQKSRSVNMDVQLDISP